MIELARAVDNPIVLRAVFGRLRFPNAWIGIGVIAVVSAFVVGSSFALAYFTPRGHAQVREFMTTSFGLIFGLQCLLLFVGGTGATASAVAADRERAVFDMMKIAPRSSAQIVGGYAFGVPIREQLWILVMMPFAWLAALFSTVSVSMTLMMYLVFYASAALYHILGTLCGIIVRQPRGASSSAVGIVLLYHMLGWLFFPHLSVSVTMIAAFSGEPDWQTDEFFALKVPVALYALAVISVVAAFLWTAAVRKYRSEERPALSKPVALLASVFTMLLLLGKFHAPMHGTSTSGSSIFGRSADAAEYAYVFLSYLVALVLVAMGTPGAALYGRSARRSEKKGGRSIGFFRDAGLNGPYALMLAGVFVATAPFLAGSLESRFFVGLVYATSLLLFATLLQWCRLRFTRGWIGVFAGALFLLWGLPIGLAIVCEAADVSQNVGALAGSAFPGIGLGYAMNGRGEAGLMVISFVNAVLAVVFFALSLKASERHWSGKAA